MLRNMEQFDLDHAEALRRIWLLGDVHGQFRHIAQALLDATDKPRWLVFLGDIDIDHRPFRQILQPLHRNYPAVKVVFIHGNHDGDTYAHWDMLHDCGDALPIHAQVADLDGVRVAGLGGNFLGRIWKPPGPAFFQSKKAAMNRGSFQYRDGQRPNPKLHAAIYPEDVEHLSRLRADILITHEAPSCHPYGFAAIDELARSMGVVRSFHAHQHDDRSDEYALIRSELGFDARALGYCSIKNGLGEMIFEGEAGW